MATLPLDVETNAKQAKADVSRLDRTLGKLNRTTAQATRKAQETARASGRVLRNRVVDTRRLNRISRETTKILGSQAQGISKVRREYERLYEGTLSRRLGTFLGRVSGGALRPIDNALYAAGERTQELARTRARQQRRGRGDSPFRVAALQTRGHFRTIGDVAKSLTNTNRLFRASFVAMTGFRAGIRSIGILGRGAFDGLRGGIRGVRQGFRRLRDGGASVVDTFRRLAGGIAITRAALLGFAGLSLLIGGLRGAVRSADALVNSLNALRAAGNSRLSIGPKFAFIAFQATRANASILRTTTLVGRLQQFGGFNFAEATTSAIVLEKAIQLSGTTSAEASGAIRQLIQGVARGELRGQELLSVLEQMPFVARLIAKELGVLPGTLNQVAQEGRITADVVKSALLNNAADVAEQYRQLTPTFAKSWSVFGDGALLAGSLVGKLVTQTTGLNSLLRVTGRALADVFSPSAGEGAVSAIARFASPTNFLAARREQNRQRILNDYASTFIQRQNDAARNTPASTQNVPGIAQQAQSTGFEFAGLRGVPASQTFDNLVRLSHLTAQSVIAEQNAFKFAGLRGRAAQDELASRVRLSELIAQQVTEEQRKALVARTPYFSGRGLTPFFAAASAANERQSRQPVQRFPERVSGLTEAAKNLVMSFGDSVKQAVLTGNFKSVGAAIIAAITGSAFDALYRSVAKGLASNGGVLASIFGGAAAGVAGRASGGATGTGLYRVNETTPKTEFFQSNSRGRILTNEQGRLAANGGGGNVYNIGVQTPEQFREMLYRYGDDLKALAAA